MNLQLLNQEMNILMVDDDVTLQNLLASFFSSKNIRFQSAFSAQEVLRKKCLDHINVVLLDVQLPDMNGFDFSKALNKLVTHPFATLFLSGVNMDTQSICQGYDSGCVDYLLKPIDPSILLKKVQAAYENTQHILELEYVVEEKLALEEELLKIDIDF